MLEYYRITWMNILYLTIGGWSSVGLVWILSGDCRKKLLELKKWKDAVEQKDATRREMNKERKKRKKK
jgi:hypothetical protein